MNNVEEILSSGRGCVYSIVGRRRTGDTTSPFEEKTYESTEGNLASCLAQIVEEHPNLARLIEVWSKLAEDTRAEILRFAGVDHE